MNTTSVNPVEQTYLDVELLIKTTVHKFQRQYGGDFDDMMGEANLVYMKAYMTYNSSKAVFSTWLCNCIWNKLLNNMIMKYREKNTTKGRRVKVLSYNYGYEESPEKFIFESITDTPPNMTDILDMLQDDAKYIADLVLNPEKASTVYSMYCSEFSCRKSLLDGITKHLKQDLNWSRKRILEAYTSLKKIID
jgi:hypothetical protein